MGHVRNEASQRGVGFAEVGEQIADALRGSRHRVERALESIGAFATRGRDRTVEAASGLRPSAPLRHGLAATERGNLEAAISLLNEAAELAPGDATAVLALWNVALLCERPAVAGPALARWIHAEASAGRLDLATAYWIELTQQVPEPLVDAPTLVRILPELRSRVATALPKARGEAEAWLQRALRQSVHPDVSGLTPGLALRIFEQARFLDAATARRAGEFVLADSGVHETKRRSIEALLAQLDSGEAAAQGAVAASDAIQAIPVQLSQSGLILLDVESRSRMRVDHRSIEAIAVARVGGLGPEPVLLIDLVLRRAPRARERQIVRMCADDFDPTAVLSEQAVGDDPLRSMLGALLDYSGAVPLPDVDGALGIEPRCFDSIAEFEGEVLARLSSQ